MRKQNSKLLRYQLSCATIMHLKFNKLGFTKHNIYVHFWTMSCIIYPKSRVNSYHLYLKGNFCQTVQGRIDGNQDTRKKKIKISKMRDIEAKFIELQKNKTGSDGFRFTKSTLPKIGWLTNANKVSGKLTIDQLMTIFLYFMSFGINHHVKPRP